MQFIVNKCKAMVPNILKPGDTEAKIGIIVDHMQAHPLHLKNTTKSGSPRGVQSKTLEVGKQLSPMVLGKAPPEQALSIDYQRGQRTAHSQYFSAL